MKLKVNLGALTRKEHTCVIEVPDTVSEDDWTQIARVMYEHTEAEDFEDDLEFWERGECWCVKVDDATEVTSNYPHPEDWEEDDDA